MTQPHFVRNYNRYVRRLMAAAPDHEAAMALAVGGGSYTEIGGRTRRFLESLGLQGTDYVIDIGAGSGRLTTALKDLPDLRYMGTDVVPELLEFARNKSGREDWTFKLVDRIEIPEADAVADFVVFFSVLTHLEETESYRYLQEARRVIKKNGKIVVSFLDPDVPLHARIVGKSWTQPNWWKERLGRISGRGVLSKLLSKKVLERWSRDLNLSVEYADEALGQSVCVYRLA